MKKIIYLIIFTTTILNCEEVIDVDVPTVDPRLNIDAIIRVNESATTTNVSIKANLTNSFFEDIDPVDLDLIGIRNLDLETDNTLLLSKSESGLYEATVNTNFLTNGNLLLFIQYNNENYIATTSYVSSPPFDKLELGDKTLFGGDEKELIVTYTDISNEDNYYLFDFDFDQFLLSEDTFYKNETFEFSYFYDDIEQDTEATVSILGVDFAFYNYFKQIIVQSGDRQGPFQTPSGTVRGNIINITSDTMGENIEDLNIEELNEITPNENFALGYFSVNQTFTEKIVITVE